MGGNHGYPNYCRNWMGIPHRTLYDEIHSGPGTSATQGTRDTYDEIGALFAEVESDIQRGLEGISAAYEGSGSEAAQSGISVLKAWTNDAQTSSWVAGQAVTSQTIAYSGARMSIPEPVEVTAQDGFFDRVSDFFGGTTPREAQEAQARAAHQEAARVMSMYDGTTFDAVSAMPTWVPPPSVTVEVASPTPTATSISSAGTQSLPSNSPGATNGTGTTAPPLVAQPPQIQPGNPQAGPGAGLGSGPGDGGVTIPPPGSGTPAPTPGAGSPTPPSLPHPPGGPPPLGGPLPPGGPPSPGGAPQPGGGLVPGAPPIGTMPRPVEGGGGHGPGGRPAGPGQLGLRGGVGTAEPGGFGPRGPATGGGPGTAGGAGGRAAFWTTGLADDAAPAARGGGAGARGVGGTGGSGILGPAAPGAGREDDREHKRKYQVNSDEFFADDRRVPPPVIGENPRGRNG